MSPSKMTILTGVTAFLGAFAVGVHADASTSTSDATEIAQAQEIGTMTASGSLVYSMSICTTVHHTVCQVYLSTGGPVPSVESPSALGYPTTVPGIPGSYSSVSQAVPVPGASSTAPGEQLVTTIVTADEVITTAMTTSEVTKPSTTGTGENTSVTTTAAGPTTTGAAAGLTVVPAAVLGAVGMAMAFLA